MKARYDPSIDALYITLIHNISPRAHLTTREVAPAV